MIRALYSQTNGRKRNRFNTFRASCNPVPPKHSFWLHLKAILKPNSASQRSIHKPTSVSQWIGKDTRASCLNKMAIIFMKCTKTTLYSLQFKVTTQWKARIYNQGGLRRELIFRRGGLITALA